MKPIRLAKKWRNLNKKVVNLQFYSQSSQKDIPA